jgi:quinol monooxygenase YgiN
LTATLHAASEKRLELQQFLERILVKIREEKGCWEVKAYQSLEDKNFLTLFMRWESMETMSAFRHTNTFKALLGSKILLQHKPEIGLEVVGKSVEKEKINANI